MKKSMLIFILKKEWYEKIKSGEKTIEYREVKPYWERRLQNFKNEYSRYAAPKDREFFLKNYPVTLNRLRAYCVLRKGYTTKGMIAIMTKIEIVDGKNTDLHIDKPVFAIHFAEAEEYHPHKDGKANAIKQEAARSFVATVGRLAQSYDLPVFVVTDGASLTHNKNCEAVRHARICHIEWEKQHGIEAAHSILSDFK